MAPLPSLLNSILPNLDETEAQHDMDDLEIRHPKVAARIKLLACEETASCSLDHIFALAAAR